MQPQTRSSPTTARAQGIADRGSIFLRRKSPCPTGPIFRPASIRTASAAF
jgi:hypothetical protein